MKLLLIAPSVVKLGTGRYGGIEKMLVDFAAALHAASHEVTIAAPHGSAVPPGVNLLETVVLPQQQDRDDITDRTVGDVSSFDAIHDFSHLHGLSHRPGRLPAIYHLWHPMVYRYETSGYNAICVSDWQLARFQRLYGQTARAMPLLVDTEVFKPIRDAKRQRFLFLGNISPRKGVHIAIELARAIDAELDVVGGLIPSEAGSEYVRLIERLCTDDPIRFHFDVTEEEKVRFLQNAKAVIYPVQQEEAGWLAGLEAWSCGTPTIALNRGSMSSILPGMSRVSCVVDTERELIAKMRSVPSTGELDAFTDCVRASHAPVRIAAEYTALYSKVADGLRWS